MQQPFPLWYGGFGEKMTARAAKEGYHYFGRNIDVYVNELKRWGRNPEEFNTGLRGRFTVVATKAAVEEARSQAQEIADRHNAEYSKTGRDLAFPFLPPSTQEAVVGTPDMILKELEPTFKGSMFTYYELQGEGDMLKLIAKEILPTLKTWGREPVEFPKARPEVEYSGFRGQ